MDITQRLHAVASAMQGLLGPAVIAEGIAEIDRLRPLHSAAQRYEWITKAVARADSVRDRYPDLHITITLAVGWMTIRGVVAGDERREINRQVAWLLFEEAKINLLLEHVNEIARELAPYATDLGTAK